MKKIGKVVLIACIGSVASAVLTVSCSFRSEKTGEEITLREKAQEVSAAIVNASDETKANALDAMSVLLTLVGLGGAGGLVKLGSNYFRNRKTQKKDSSASPASEKTSDGGV